MSTIQLPRDDRWGELGQGIGNLVGAWAKKQKQNEISSVLDDDSLTDETKIRRAITLDPAVAAPMLELYLKGKGDTRADAALGLEKTRTDASVRAADENIASSQQTREQQAEAFPLQQQGRAAELAQTRQNTANMGIAGQSASMDLAAKQQFQQLLPQLLAGLGTGGVTGVPGATAAPNATPPAPSGITAGPQAGENPLATVLGGSGTSAVPTPDAKMPAPAITTPPGQPVAPPTTTMPGKIDPSFILKLGAARSAQTGSLAPLSKAVDDINKMAEQNRPIPTPESGLKVADQAATFTNSATDLLNAYDSGKAPSSVDAWVTQHMQEYGYVPANLDTQQALAASHQLLASWVMTGGGFGGDWKTRLGKQVLPNLIAGPLFGIVELNMVAKDQLSAVDNHLSSLAGTKAVTAPLEKQKARLEELIAKTSTLKSDKQGNVYYQGNIVDPRTAQPVFTGALDPDGEPIKLGKDTFSPSDINMKAMELSNQLGRYVSPGTVLQAIQSKQNGLK